MSEHEVTVQGAEVRLRRPARSDHEEMFRWRSDPETLRQLMSRHRAEKLEDVEAWVARRTRDPDGVLLVIAAGPDQEPIGFVQLTEIDRLSGHASLGLFVHERARGTGVAAEVLRQMEARAAREYGLRKIVIEVLASNTRALRFWRGRGYRSVGTLEEHFADEGVCHDVEIMEKRIGP